MKHIKQLDSVRAFAVIIVVLSHWTLLASWLDMPIGGMGVDIFFVLSGFLITQILLENRKSALDANDKKNILKNYFIRRTLRIFPLYYLTITVWFIIRHASGDATHDYWYYYLYLSNYHIYLHNAGGKLLPTWSLSVEEQFYLVWPWLMILIPRKRVFVTIIAFIVVGISSNYVLCEILPIKNYINWLTPTCFDALGAGALLAYIITERPDWLPKFQRWLNIFALVALALLILKYGFRIPLPIPVRTLVAIIGLFAVNYCLTPKKSFLYEKVLGNELLIQIGKVSYAIYLFHNLLPPVWGSILNKLERFQIPFINYFYWDVNKDIVLFCQHLVILAVLTTLSWRYFEKPINNLKRYFSYGRKDVRQTATSPL